MGRLSGWPCPQWSGPIALRSAERLPAEEDERLTSHLEKCATCREELARLVPVSRLLASHATSTWRRGADPHPGRDEVPSGTAWAVAKRLDAEQRRERRRRALATLGAASGVAVVLASVMSGLLVSSPPPRGERVTVVLRGTPHVDATAQLSATRWGTAVSLRETGQPAGRVYYLAMRTTDGYWWTAGSYRTTAGATRAKIACGAPLHAVVRMVVRDGTGQTVLGARLR